MSLGTPYPPPKLLDTRVIVTMGLRCLVGSVPSKRVDQILISSELYA